MRGRGFLVCRSLPPSIPLHFFLFYSLMTHPSVSWPLWLFSPPLLPSRHPLSLIPHPRPGLLLPHLSSQPFCVGSLCSSWAPVPRRLCVFLHVTRHLCQLTHVCSNPDTGLKPEGHSYNSKKAKSFHLFITDSLPALPKTYLSYQCVV